MSRSDAKHAAFRVRERHRNLIRHRTATFLGTSAVFWQLHCVKNIAVRERAFAMLWAILGIGVSGCAAGYGMGHSSHSMPVKKNAGIVSNDRAFDVSTTYHEFRLVDSSGLLLGAVTNTSRAHAAREQALENPNNIKRGPGDTAQVEYSYEPFPILSGVITDLRLRVGSSSDVASDTEQTFDDDYWGFDLRGEPVAWQLFPRSVSSLFFATSADNYSAKTTDGFSEYDVSLFALDVLVGGATTYVPRKDLAVTSRLGVGFISPIMGALVGGPYLNGNLEVEAGYLPFARLMIAVNASLERKSVLDTPMRSLTGTRIGLSLSYSFGDTNVMTRQQD
jgi:hypothetical protein